MSKIVVFGAGGRAGRRVTAEAAARGHQVTAVVRDPAKHADLAGDGVTVVAGDVTDAASVAEAADGHDVAVNATARMDVSSREFYVAAAEALLDGLARAGTPRLVAVGIGTTLEAAPGMLVHDAPGFPAEAREFSLGHLAELGVLRSAAIGLDWVVLAPPPIMLDDNAARTGQYRTGDGRVLPIADGATFSYADLAVAIVDEIETPKHTRALIAVAP